MRYELLEKDKVNYICVVILAEIINYDSKFSTKLTGDDLFVQPYLELMAKATTPLVKVKGGEYVATPAGREVLVGFIERYYEFLKMFDVFCAVDLEAGEFAFAKILDPSLYDEEWNEHIREERFSDIRVAVADFKGLNPIEIVFMSFLNEGVFDKHPQWGYDLTGQDLWHEIEGICNNAIDVDYLKVDGVLEDIITKGSQLAIDLVKDAQESEDEEFNIGRHTTDGEWNNSDLLEEVIEEEEVVITEEVVEYVDIPVYGYDHWDPYYDPYYVSPLWLVPIILW